MPNRPITEFLSGNPEIVPGRAIHEARPVGKRRTCAPVDIPSPGSSQSHVCIERLAVDDGVAVNVAGGSFSLKDLSGINGNLFALGYSFPGGDTDDNEVHWKILVPENISTTPNLTVRLYLVEENA